METHTWGEWEGNLKILSCKFRTTLFQCAVLSCSQMIPKNKKIRLKNFSCKNKSTSLCCTLREYTWEREREREQEIPFSTEKDAESAAK